MKRNQMIEIVGGTAVVLSLIFVGLELRQNTAALSAQALAELNLASNLDFHLSADNEDIAELNVRGREGIDGMNEVELERYKNSWYAPFNTYEAAFLYYRKGIIDSDDYETWRRGACDSIQVPGVKDLVDTGELSLNDEFKKELENCDSP